MLSSSRATALFLALSGQALAYAPQPHVQVPNPAPLPILAYEVDYATSNTFQDPNGVYQTDTIVSLGLPSGLPKTQCNLQIAWFDSNGALVNYSGPFPLATGQTYEFTSSPNLANPTQYVPFEENVFRSINADGTAPSFEGFAQILTDSKSCLKLRVDAEFVVNAQAVGSPSVQTRYKPINVTNPRGASGY